MKKPVSALFTVLRLVTNSCVVLQRRRWSGSRRCAPIRWFPAHTHLPSGDEASLQRWAVCSSPGNGGRRKVRSSSRPQLVRNPTGTHGDICALKRLLWHLVLDWLDMNTEFQFIRQRNLLKTSRAPCGEQRYCNKEEKLPSVVHLRLLD